MDFSIVILENQVHSAKSILEEKNLLLAKNTPSPLKHLPYLQGDQTGLCAFFLF